MNSEDGSSTPIEASLRESVLKLGEPNLHYRPEGFYIDTLIDYSRVDRRGPAVLVVEKLAQLEEAGVDKIKHPVISEYESAKFPKDRLEADYSNDLAEAIIDLGHLAGIAVQIEVGGKSLGGKEFKPNVLKDIIGKIDLPARLKRRISENEARHIEDE